MNAIFLCGLPGAGKSYYISNNFDINNYVVINSDHYLEYLASIYDVNLICNKSQINLYNAYKNCINSFVNTKLMYAIFLKKDIIIDSTLCDYSLFCRRYNLLSLFNYNIFIHLIETKIDDCLYNIKHRSRNVDTKYVYDCAQHLENNKKYYSKLIQKII